MDALGNSGEMPGAQMRIANVAVPFAVALPGAVLLGVAACASPGTVTVEQPPTTASHSPTAAPRSAAPTPAVTKTVTMTPTAAPTTAAPAAPATTAAPVAPAAAPAGRPERHPALGRRLRLLR